ncbi:MAG: hypothetical protein JXR11_10700 [Balneola sp.]
MNLTEKLIIEEKKFSDILKQANDPISALLKTHLFIEQLLEVMIRIKLPNPDILLNGRGLGFSKKVHLVQAFNILDQKTYEAILRINKIRNDCAHIIDTKLDIERVEELGNILRPWFSEMKDKYPDDQEFWLEYILANLVGRVAAYTHTLNEVNVQK